MSQFFKVQRMPAGFSKYFRDYFEYDIMLNELFTVIDFNSVDWRYWELDINKEFDLEIAKIKFENHVILIMTKFFELTDLQHALNYIYYCNPSAIKPNIYLTNSTGCNPFEKLQEIKNRYKGA